MPIPMFTIGFTQKTAETFLTSLHDHQISVLVDIRLRPDSQLAGFAKARDLRYFLRAINQCGYVHMPSLTPTDDILDTYRKDKDWGRYDIAFNALLRERKIEETLDQAWWTGERACLLCSEYEPDHCHRRLVAEYLASHWKEVIIHHII